MAAERLNEAELTARIKSFPNDANAYRDLAILLMNQGLWFDAEQRAKKYIDLRRDDPEGYDLLGTILTEAQRPALGEEYYHEALTLNDFNPETAARLAKCLRNQGRLAEARHQYTVLDKLGRLPAWALPEWAQLEEDDRRPDAAIALLKRMDGRSDNHNHRVRLASLVSQTGAAAKAAHILKRAENLDFVGVAEKGRLLDKMGLYDEAWEAWELSKRMMRAQGHKYQDGAAANMLARIGRFHSEHPDDLPRAPVNPHHPQPIFILGFPRSGTTLVEQMLSAHPEISAGGELRVLNDITNLLPYQANTSMSYPEALGELCHPDSVGVIDRVRDYYLEHVKRMGIVKDGARFFTDKMPLNETHLPLIRIMFPRSPVLYIVRHPLDVMVSMMANPLSHGWLCGSSLETAAMHYRRVIELVSGMHLEDLDMTFRYEDIVAMPRDAISTMLENSIGVPFNEACLRPQDNRRYVDTASRTQVVQPIYDRSIGRYKRYMRQLAPALVTLRPLLEWMPYAI